MENRMTVNGDCALDSPRSICSNLRRSPRNLSCSRSSGFPMPSTAAMSHNSSRLSKPDFPEILVVIVPSDVSDIVSIALLSFCITSSGLILSKLTSISPLSKFEFYPAETKIRKRNGFNQLINCPISAMRHNNNYSRANRKIRSVSTCISLKK